MESGNGSVDRWEDATPATGSGTGLDDWTEGSFDVGSSDVEILKRVWRNEKAAPDILPYEAHLIERVHEQILLMEDNTAEISKTVDDLMLSIYQMDISRTTFLLKAYLRTRLGKMSVARGNAFSLFHASQQVLLVAGYGWWFYVFKFSVSIYLAGLCGKGCCRLRSL